jgi:hypothetical protein
MTDTFLDSYADRDFSAADRARFRQALRLLDTDERHRSLRVHQLEGDLRGVWSASASVALRMTFLRGDEGMKIMLTCSRHNQP